MKKYFLILTLFLVASNLFAQEYHWGIKGGLNVADIGAKDLGYVTRLGYHFGGFTEAIITPFFSLQPELIYSLQGAAADNSREVYFNYHYLNIPLLAKVYFYQDACIDLGVQYGFLMSAYQKSQLDNFSDKITDQVNRNDFSLILGVAYKIADHYNFCIRYNIGISDTASRSIIYEQRATNRVLQISLGYLF